jgi:hypothetical protein
LQSCGAAETATPTQRQKQSNKASKILIRLEENATTNLQSRANAEAKKQPLKKPAGKK